MRERTADEVELTAEKHADAQEEILALHAWLDERLERLEWIVGMAEDVERGVLTWAEFLDEIRRLNAVGL